MVALASGVGWMFKSLRKLWSKCNDIRTITPDTRMSPNRNETRSEEVMEHQHRMIPFLLKWKDIDFEHPRDVEVMGNMDGSWYISDWGNLELLAAQPIGNDPNNAWIIMTFRLLLFARGKFEEVTKERAEEIALEYGAKNPLTFNNDYAAYALKTDAIN